MVRIHTPGGPRVQSLQYLQGPLRRALAFSAAMSSIAWVGLGLLDPLAASPLDLGRGLPIPQHPGLRQAGMTPGQADP